MTTKDVNQQPLETGVTTIIDDKPISLARRFRRRIAMAALFLLSLAMPAQAGTLSPGPQICPFFGDFLTPTLVDVLLGPVTFRQ